MTHRIVRLVVRLAVTAALAVTIGACATTKKEEEQPKPAAAAPAPEPKAAAPSGLPASYEVQRRDNLWNIAGQPRIYGNPYAWPLIYKTNSAKIKDADLIYPGQNFDIERNASAADVDRAVHHAKTRGAWKLGVVEQSDKDYLAGKR